MPQEAETTVAASHLAAMPGAPAQSEIRERRYDCEAYLLDPKSRSYVETC